MSDETEAITSGQADQNTIDATINMGVGEVDENAVYGDAVLNEPAQDDVNNRLVVISLSALSKIRFLKLA